MFDPEGMSNKIDTLPLYMIVPQLARLTQLGEDRIRNLIRSGRLAAANLNPGGRPFWKMRREDWEACWRSMCIAVKPATSPTRRRKPTPGLIEFI